MTRSRSFHSKRHLLVSTAFGGGGGGGGGATLDFPAVRLNLIFSEKNQGTDPWSSYVITQQAVTHWTFNHLDKILKKFETGKNITSTTS